MYLGTQIRPKSDDDYRVLAQLGVKHICGYPSEPASEWTVASLSRYKEKVESFGLTIDVLELPLGSRGISHAENPNIMLGKSPERDKEIDHICELIRIVNSLKKHRITISVNIG